MDNTLDLIKDYLTQRMDNPPAHLTVDSRLDELGIDSLGMIELIFELEDTYKITVPQDVPTPETVGQLIEVVEKYMPAVANE
ncbi:MAG: acyl carrier protein [Betaproteobacteria bacterium]|nr:acyl carrier protein [Betaproteobacteria bacterium]